MLVCTQDAVCAARSDGIIARIHWLGKTKVSGDTNSSELMTIWNMPESAKLEAQTIDKLSLAPWRFLRGQTNQSASSLLKPLLRDIIDEESYMEIRQPSGSTNQDCEMVLAIHLNNQHAALWDTNLAAVLESLTGIRPVRGDNRWSLKKHHAPNLIEFRRLGEWILLGAAEDHNGLLDETLDRMKQGHSPSAESKTNLWIEADIDLQRISSVHGQFHVLSNFPKISLTAVGESGRVVTRGEFALSETVSIDLAPWSFPTNLVDADLTSLTAIRGFGSWMGLWSGLQISPPPNQIYFWAARGIPMETYFAAPLPDASNTVTKLGDFIQQKMPASLTTLFNLERSPAYHGLTWHNFPYIEPFIRSQEFSNCNFIVGGSFPLAPINEPIPTNLLNQALGRSNLVYYDWEASALRVDQWIYIGQIARFAAGKPQLPAGSAGLLWLRALFPSQLGNSVTEITQIGPHELSFTRRSGIGLTAIELHLLADWLESPDFPFGLHTLNAPPASP